MLSILKQIQVLFMSLIIFMSTLFSTGQPPKNITMPDVPLSEHGQWVDPFIGTGGIPWASAMLFPGATSPYGAVRLSPDTTMPMGIEPFRFANAGYHYDQNYLLGFSHTRLSGTGVKDMGHFRVIPSIGKKNPKTRNTRPLLFSHKDEFATAGYYAVYLPTLACLAELTTTSHVGVHRYTFDSSKDAHIFIDAGSFLGDGHAKDASVTVIPERNQVIGEGRVFTDFTDRYGGLKAYFVAEFNLPFSSFATWDKNGSQEGRLFASGDDTGADLNFGNIKNQALELKLGISFVSIENARENLESQVGSLGFDEVYNQTKDEWNSWLSRIEIETQDQDIKKIFYTALYHSMIMPTDFTDVNGDYLGFNGEVGKAEGFTYRTDMSLWDTFRTTHPLMTLIAPEIQLDCVKSLVEMAKIGGRLPRWPSGSGYTQSMFGSPADMVIAETYLKGYTDFDVETAYAYMKNTSESISTNNEGRKHASLYNQFGYLPADLGRKSVSKTLEYAWADNSIALLADALGKTEDAIRFKEKSLYYKNIFNSETKYFQAKNSDGTWLTPLLPDATTYYDDFLGTKLAGAYVEGSARHWRWHAPYDARGMIELFGSDEYFVDELNSFMKEASPSLAAINPGPAYWHGNQHDLHCSYLFNEAGRPDLTQKWVRWVLSDRYSTAIDGLDGNDDAGSLSAWYVLSAVGIYPIAGTSKYWLGSPNIDGAIIDTQNNKQLSIIVENQSADNIYVQSVYYNDVKLSEPLIEHSLLADGGTLRFVMGPSAAENGGY